MGGAIDFCERDQNRGAIDFCEGGRSISVRSKQGGRSISVRGPINLLAKRDKTGGGDFCELLQ